MTAFVLAAACSEADVYVYTARRYDADGACLDPYKSVDLVDGTGAAATCKPTCFQFGDDVFTSTVCPPLPTEAVELPADAAACIVANALFDATCGALDAAPDVLDAAPDVLDAGDSGG